MQREPYWTQCEPSQTQCETQHKPVEYSLHWVRKGWVHIGVVDFMLLVSILFVVALRENRPLMTSNVWKESH